MKQTNKFLYSEIISQNCLLNLKRNTVYKNLSKSRNKNTNLIIEEGIFPPQLIYTHKNKKFTRNISENEEFLMFYTVEFLKYLKNSKKWIVDGTFLASPANFNQVYIIYGEYFFKFYPMITILCRDKKEIIYYKIFKKNSELINSIGLNFFITDNEKAAINAAKKAFPKTKFFLCLTHFSTNVFTSLRKYYLSYFFSSNAKFTRYFVL